MSMKVLKRWYGFINNISIRTKILVFSIVISIVPLGVVTTLNYYGIAEKTETSVTYSANQVFNQNRLLLENQISTIWNLSVSIASDQDIVQYNLAAHPQDYYNDYLAQNTDYRKISAFISGFQKYPIVLRAIIYASREHIFANENTNFYNMGKVEDTAWYRRLMGSKDLLEWFPERDGIVTYANGIETQARPPVIIAMRKIRDLNNYDHLLGILRIDMPLAEVARIMDLNRITPNTCAFIINSYGEAIYSTQYAQPSEMEGLGYATLLNQYGNSDKWFDFYTGHEGYLLKCTPVKYTDWLMAVMIPKADLLAISYKTRDDMILVAVITSVIVTALAGLISYSLTRRIKVLANRMQKIDSEISLTALAVDGSDELGRLQSSFNTMLGRIKTMMIEEHRLGQEVKNMELKALQAQINPHFLYNTLDLIHWRAMSKDVPEISKIVLALARFYKLGLSRGEDMVRLDNEIEHIRMYIQIQNERYRNMIELITEIDKDVAECKVLKLLLQPLVENAIVHGIMEKTEMEGRILIKAYKTTENLQIIIEDNGEGMSDEQICSLMTLDRSSEHYGIKNINERIQLLFGKEFGLQFQSTIGKGTTVIISLPLLS